MPNRSLVHDQLKTSGVSDLSRRATGGRNCDGVCTGGCTGIWIADASAPGTAASAPATSASDQSQGKPESNNAHHA